MSKHHDNDPIPGLIIYLRTAGMVAEANAVASLTSRAEAAEKQVATLIKMRERDTRDAHDVVCNHRAQPIGGPGCVCVTVNKHELSADRARIAELEAEVTKAAGEVAEYLKEGETVVECIQRNRDDVTQMLGMLATERQELEQCRAKLEKVMARPSVSLSTYEAEVSRLTAELEKAEERTVAERISFFERDNDQRCAIENRDGRLRAAISERDTALAELAREREARKEAEAEVARLSTPTIKEGVAL